jgi:DUF4097 and DUF4098 domain-containing protein YvlB/uncharacterized protein YacL (UPF0231 family)
MRLRLLSQVKKRKNSCHRWNECGVLGVDKVTPQALFAIQGEASMSWLYSLVFAGLLLSSSTEQPAVRTHAVVEPAPAIAATVGDEIEKFEQSYPLSKNGNVSVSNVNGSIIVEAWDRDEVRLEATKIADSKETLADVELKINSTADSFRVDAEYKSWMGGDNGKENNNRYRKLEVEFRLSVPRAAVLNEIETVNGSVTVSNFINITKVSTVNGNVSAANLRGAANLSTVNGTVSADFERVDPSSKINLNTVNGQVNLVVPSDLNATIKADSLNGNITNDFGLPVRKGQYVGRDMYGRVGSGETQIRLSSVNGGLTVTRKNDGRSLSPSTNLLPNKKNDDDDWDGDDERTSQADAAHVDREVARATRDARRAAAQGIKEAQKTLESIGPVMEKIKTDELEKLDKMKIDVEEQKIKTKIKEGLKDRQDQMERLNEMIGFERTPSVTKKRNAFTVKGVPKVNVDVKGCSLMVRGWDKSEVQYVVSEVAGRRSQPATVTDSQDSTSVTIKVANTASTVSPFTIHSDPERVRIEVFVPRKANLKIVTDGELRLDGVSGDIQLKGGDQSINVRDVDGSLSLTANEALVRVIGFKGELTSQTECGDVFLEGDFKKLSAKATDGTVTLTVPSDANATFTSNTDIESDGVEFVRENDHTWRLGKGGIKYNFDFNEGKLVVRSSAAVNTN